jgi:hypothetical protein
VWIEQFEVQRREIEREASWTPERTGFSTSLGGPNPSPLLLQRKEKNGEKQRKM